MKKQNWRRIFKHQTQSPIESMLLSEFLEMGITPMLQYPLDVFYIDFAFPEKKLAIEVDGYKYHSPEKDAYKNKRIKELGWSIERFDGWFINRYVSAAVGKIALQYFSDKLNANQKNYALGGLSTYFATTEPIFAQRLMQLRAN
jgi:very-short-patch-repair endonuclease